MQNSRKMNPQDASNSSDSSVINPRVMSQNELTEPSGTKTLTVSRPHAAEPIRVDRPRTQVPRGTTGPKTEAGKQRSSRNAIRHGIFSEVILLKGECPEKLASLRAGLLAAYHPEGSLEELLVDKLVTISWRSRRLLTAETAEIQYHTEFLEWDRCNQQREEAERIGSGEKLRDEPGLIWNIRNSEILERCLQLLSELRQEIASTGFQQERDMSVLDKIYGENATSLRETLRDIYLIWSETAEAPEEERARERYATPQECKRIVLDGIDADIQRLKVSQKKSAAIESQRTRVEILRRSVPDTPGLNRLMQYGARLERDFDRTLAHLERVQQLRLGKPVPPRLDVTISKE